MGNLEEIKCPYCGAKNEFEGFEMEEGEVIECVECGKHFSLRSETLVTYYADKLDCVNGLAEHKWRLAVFPNPIDSFVRCTICEELRKQLTEEEMEQALRESERVYGKWPEGDNNE